jgi:hypothetical protein
MTDNVKSIIYAAVALLVVGIAFLTRPASPTTAPVNVGDKLFVDFTDPLAVASLEIVKFDDDISALSKFRVAEVEGVWVITSKENYPADAEDKVAKTANSVMDLEIVGVATENKSEHKVLGVVEPDFENLSVGDTGVGTLVTIKDNAGEVLASMIIGNEVEGDDNEDDLRYVRRQGQDIVFTVKVDTSELSPKFQDWIEKDLLGLSSWDVSRVTINDYAIAIDPNSRGLIATKSLQQRGVLELSVDGSDWTAEDLQSADAKGALVKAPLKKDEELNTDTLGDLKSALADLKVVSVSRKPPALAAMFGSKKSAKPSREIVDSLREHGYIPRPTENGLEIFSDDGEVIVGLKTGVQYLLRFGETAGLGEAEPDDKKEGDEKKEDEKDKEVGLDRYILVQAQVNPDLIEKPEIKPLPELPGATAKKPAEKEPAPKEPATKKDEPKKKPADPADADNGNGNTNETSTKTSKPSGNQDEAKKDAAKKDPAKKDDAKQDTPAKKDDAAKKKNPAKKDAVKKDPAAKDPAAKDPADDKAKLLKDLEALRQKNRDLIKKALGDEKEAAPKETPEEATKRIKAEQKKIAEENKQAKADYDKKLDEAKETVRELNYRFADWYFVISEDVYKKIHLSRSDVVRKKEAKKADDAKVPAGHPKLPGGFPSNFKLPGQ